ncbi:MAG: hypothetical protein CVT98_02540 [Bacteroidetes bacterium HGW-Bacteroidetes-15]|nr:MAG: hypothetical protein CVT98_02540 [Bacteroidetes bacterium HGW-Bacteroidetes-15]
MKNSFFGEMLVLKKIKPYCYFVLLIMISFGGGSCGKQVYPSGLEGNLLGYNRYYESEQQKRLQIARKFDSELNQKAKKENKPLLKEAKQFEKEKEKFVKDHMARQEPHVQARMKQNLKETKKYYSSQKSFKEKLVFWKKNKCTYGIG